MARILAEAPKRPAPSRPIPVALVITDLDVGGAERAMYQLATRLDPGRWTPKVIALGPEAELFYRLRERGVAASCLDVRPSRPFRSLRRLVDALRSHRPALIQSFLFHANIASRLAMPMVGVPVVLGGIRVAEREKRWHLALERLTAAMTTGVVCVSDGVARDLRSRTRWPLGRMTTIPNGVEPARFDSTTAIDRASLGVPEGRTLILFVGRIATQKDVPLLLDAARLVAGHRADWTLLIAGDGPLRPELEARTAADPPLADRVRWLGFRPDVPALLKAADVFVLPSRWEGMPNAVLEAMAAGLPVVATATEGTEDLVLDGENGWLVRDRAPETFADALLEAIAGPAEARRRGANGRRRVASDFSIGAMIGAFDALWSGLLGDRGTGHPNINGVGESA